MRVQLEGRVDSLGGWTDGGIDSLIVKYHVAYKMQIQLYATLGQLCIIVYETCSNMNESSFIYAATKTLYLSGKNYFSLLKWH